MEWRIGIDEAGYGPNLGPFVMTAVAIETADAQVDFWQLLRAVVRRVEDSVDDRLIVADSKQVFTPQRGLTELEKSVLGILLGSAREMPPSEKLCLRVLLDQLAPQDHAEVQEEFWYEGQSACPWEADGEVIAIAAKRFRMALADAGLALPLVRSVVVCPRRFNALSRPPGNKAFVSAQALQILLRSCWTTAPPATRLEVDIDKQGGRNYYGAWMQPAFAPGMVLAREERFTRSIYEVIGLDGPVRLTLAPRADAACFAVALASMISKYLRELLMVEFNAFWRRHVPQIKPTAGYPGDSRRFWREILPTFKRLPLVKDQVWRSR